MSLSHFLRQVLFRSSLVASSRMAGAVFQGRMLKERLVWRSGFETLDQARKENAAYIDAYHHRPHSGLRYRTPTEVRKTWEDGQRLLKTAA